MNTSILLSLRDEIALEGLEGITFEALRIRLNERDRFMNKETKQQPLFSKLDDDKLFKIVVNEAKNGNIGFFQLPKPRPPLVIFNRDVHFNADTGTLMYDPDLVPEDIYSPIVAISEQGVRGSCRDFQTRVCFTQEISQMKSFDQFKSFDHSSVVMVASQKLRSSALFGPLKWQAFEDMKLSAYCILEHVARKRFYGYLNSKKETMKFEDARIKRSYYYFRNELLKNFMVVQFPVYFYDFKRKLCHNSFALYMPRFKPTNVNPMDWKVVQIGNMFVSQQVTKFSFTEIKEKMKEIHNEELTEDSSSKKVDPKKFRDFLQRYGKVFSIERDEQLKEIVIEYLRPLSQPLTVNDLYPRYGEKLKDVDCEEPDAALDPSMDETMDLDDTIPDITQEMETDGDSVQLNKESALVSLPQNLIHLKCNQLKRYFFERVYSLIEQFGQEGCTRIQLLRLVDIPNSLIRNALKILQGLDLIYSSAIQKGRQKVYMYRSKKFKTDDQLSEVSSAAAQPSSVSDRTKFRLQILVEHLSKVKMVDNVFSLRRFIMCKETHLPFKIDMKTVMRLLNQLASMNLIKIKYYRLSYLQFSRNSLLIFYNDNAELNQNEPQNVSISNDDFIRENGHLYVNNLIKHCLRCSKFHYFAGQSIDLEKDIQETSIEPNPDNIQWNQSVDISLNGLIGEEDFEATPTTASDEKILVNYQPSIARRMYGCKQSKVERSFQLYRFLHYLLVDKREKSESLLKGDWRYYVPKLTRIFPDFKCSLVDAIIYMPISVFRDIYQISHIIPGLETLLNDPIKQHQLLYQVDPLIRRHLLYNRKSVNIIYELLEWSSHFGLLKMEERHKMQHSETVRFTLKTTMRFSKPLVSSYTETAPGACEYNFDNISNFDQFVLDVQMHLDNRQSGCPQNECPFEESLMIHSVVAFGFRRKRQTSREDEYEEGTAEIRKRKRSSERLLTKRKKRKEKKQTVLPKIKKSKQIETEKKPKKIGQFSRAIRQFFNRQEDQFILKCRLASLLLDPNSNSQTCISRTVICQLLHEHIGPSSYVRDAMACSRRLLKLSKKPHIQRILAFALHELDYIDMSSLRPANKNDSEAMTEAFKITLDKILTHKFMNTEFFMNKADLQSRLDNTGATSMALKQSLPTISSIISQYEIVDIYNPTEKIIYKDPINFYHIHIYVLTNLLLSTLISLKFALNASGTNQTPSIASKRFYLRTMFKLIRNFPERRVQETILNLIENNMIKRNRQNQDNKRNSCYEYRISPSFFQKLTEFNVIFEQSKKSTDNSYDQGKGLLIEDENSLFASVQFIEALSSDILGVIDVEPKDPVTENATHRPIQFHIGIPQKFMSIPKEYTRKTERGRHVSRSLMLSQNSGQFVKEEILENESDTRSIDSMRFTDSMLINHLKVHVGREPHSVQLTETHEAVIEQLQIHLRTFTPSEFEPNLDSSALTERCLDDYPPFKLRASSISRLEYQNIITTLQNVKSEGLGQNWEQLAQLLRQRTPRTEQELRQFLKFCEIQDLIFAVGIVNMIWVHRDHVRYWFLYSYENLETWTPSQVPPNVDKPSTLASSGENETKINSICFIPKLWKLPDGKLDLDTLMASFNCIIGHLTFTKTVMNREEIIDTFKSILSPVQLFELIDMLIILECVRKSQILVARSSVEESQVKSFDDFFTIPDVETLTFSEPPSSIDNIDCHYQMETVYEASVDAYTRLSLLYNSLKARYGSRSTAFEQQQMP